MKTGITGTAAIAAIAAIVALTVVFLVPDGRKTPDTSAHPSSHPCAPVAAQPWDWHLIDSLREMLREYNVAHTDIVAAQAILETGHFRDDNYRVNCNLFGMRQAAKRPFVTRGERKAHAVYADWRESVLDYALLQAWERKNLTEKQYIESLRGYAKDGRYREEVKKILKTIRARDAREKAKGGN